MKLIIEISCDNEAFGEEVFACVIELNSILGSLCWKIKDEGFWSQNLVDSNGDHVGTLEVVT